MYKHKIKILLFLCAIVFLLNPQLITKYSYLLNNISWEDGLTQTLAVGLGVFLGMYVDKKTDKKKIDREAACLLEALFADIQSLLSSINILKDTINSRPSLYFSSKGIALDKLLLKAKEEEEFIANCSSQLSDRTYTALLPDLIKIPNRRLLEEIISAYERLKTVKFSLQIRTHDNDYLYFSEDEKKDSWETSLTSFAKEVEALIKLDEFLRNLQTNLKQEARILRQNAENLIY